MLRTFVTDADLFRFLPKLANIRWANQTDYSPQINEAFHIVQTDLNNLGLLQRLLQTPLDLVSSGLTANFVTTVSVTGNTVGSGTKGDRNYKRFVFNPVSITGNWTNTLQGSNDNVTFENAGESMSVSILGEVSQIFVTQYKYWRYNIVRTSTGTTDAITFSTSLVETVWDQLVIYKAIELISIADRRLVNDPSDLNAKRFEQLYDNEKSSVKYLYDVNDDGVIQDKEVQMSNNYQFVL